MIDESEHLCCGMVFAIPWLHMDTIPYWIIGGVFGSSLTGEQVIRFYSFQPNESVSPNDTRS